MYKSLLKKLCTLIFCVIIVSCSKKKDNDNTPEPDTKASDRSLVLTHIADNIIIPSYAAFKVKLDSMVICSDIFTASPTDSSLKALRNSWVKAYIEWEKVELFDFGPAANQNIRYFFNIYPANVSAIQNNISNGNADLTLPVTYAAQGFSALDYLLNGLGTSDSEILAQFTTASDASQRIQYLGKLVDRMKTLFYTVNSEWPSYRNTFITKTGLDAGSSFSILVNEYVMHYERYIRAGKFGIPSGVMVGSEGITYPQNVEAYYKKDLSLTLAQTAHTAAVDFFNGKNVKTGTEGPSFKTYLNALNAKDSQTGTSLSSIINTQFTAIKSKMNLLSDDLSQEVQTNNQAVVAVYNEMQNLVRLLKVDMTSAMSITISYTDNDGD